MGNKSSRNKYKYNHLKTSSDEYDYSEHFESVNPNSQYNPGLRNRMYPTTAQQMQVYPPIPQPIPTQEYPQIVDDSYYSQYNPQVINQHVKPTNESLVFTIQYVINLIIDFTIDNYRISYKLEEAVNKNQFQLMINVHEICIMIYNMNKHIIEQSYQQELIANDYDLQNKYVNFLENIIFSTVNPYSKITDLLLNNNIPSFIEQIQELLDPYILIFSEDYSYVTILIN
jgi:hypothetical protein